MQFFLDTAELAQIEQGIEWGMVDGVTTNPSLIASQGDAYLPTVKKIAELVPGPVSGEVLATDYEGMMEQARKLADLAENIVIKLPLTPDGLRTTRTLSQQSVKTNVTLCFSSAQALLAAKAGASYISPFIGRLDDLGQDGMQLIGDILQIYRHYGFDTQVLVASVRSPLHVVKSAQTGADVVTLPFSVLKKLYRHPLTETGLAGFLSDWRETGRNFDD